MQILKEKLSDETFNTADGWQWITASGEKLYYVGSYIIHNGRIWRIKNIKDLEEQWEFTVESAS